MAALLSNLLVIFVPITAFFVLRGRVSSLSKAALVLSLFGIILVLPPGLRITGVTLGDMMLVGSAVRYTAFIVLGKRFGISFLASSFAVIVSVAVITAPMAIMMGGPVLLGGLLAPANWASAIRLGIPCTVVALTMYTGASPQSRRHNRPHFRCSRLWWAECWLSHSWVRRRRSFR